jgi:hypothetical protein
LIVNSGFTMNLKTTAYELLSVIYLKTMMISKSWYDMILRKAAGEERNLNSRPKTCSSISMLPNLLGKGKENPRSFLFTRHALKLYLRSQKSAPYEPIHTHSAQSTRVFCDRRGASRARVLESLRDFVSSMNHNILRDCRREASALYTSDTGSSVPRMGDDS